MQNFFNLHPLAAFKRFIFTRVFGIFSLFFSISAFADTPPAAAKISSSSQLASLVGALALIIVLIYGLSWFVKRFTQGGFLQNPAIKIVASLQLGARERLALVQVGDKQLLLGISATQINCLQTFDEPVWIPEEKTSPINSEFSQKLMNILQQKTIIDSKKTTIDSKKTTIDAKKAKVDPKKTTEKPTRE